MFFFFLKPVCDASSLVAVTYIAPCMMSPTLRHLSTWHRNDFLLLQGYLRHPALIHTVFYLKHLHTNIKIKQTKKKNL